MNRTSTVTTCTGPACHVKAAEADHLLVEGIAAPWSRDLNDERFVPGAFAAGLADYLRRPVLLYHHDPTRALGRVLEARETPDGLWIRARVERPPRGSADETIYTQLARGIPYGFSVGGKWGVRNGKIGEARISEVSLTPQPVNMAARAKVAAGTSPQLGELAERIVAIESGLAKLRQPVEAEAEVAAAKAIREATVGAHLRMTPARRKGLREDVDRLRHGIDRYRHLGDEARLREIENRIAATKEAIDRAERERTQPRRHARAEDAGLTETRKPRV